MSKILIAPIKIKTKGGLDVEINGIDPSCRDCVCGKYKDDQAWKEACWNETGIMCGGVDDTNIDPSGDEFSEVVGLVGSIKNKI